MGPPLDPAWVPPVSGGNLYLARIYVSLKAAVNDPQGSTVLNSLKHMGFESVADVRVGKYLEVRVEEADRTRAESVIQDICEKLLSNPVIEEFSFDLVETPGPAAPRTA